MFPVFRKNSFWIFFFLLPYCGQGVRIPEGSYTAPSIERVASLNPSGTYTVGQNLLFEVTFSAVVWVTGIPQLLLNVGQANRAASYASGSGTKVLVFIYTVQTEDSSAALDYPPDSALNLNGGGVVGLAGQSASLTLPTGGGYSISGSATIIIDTTGASLPVSFNAVAGDSQIALSWASGGSDTSGYVVVRRSSSAVTWEPNGGTTYSLSENLGSSQTVIYVGTNTNVTDTSLTNNTQYHYKVVAYDAVKNYSTGATTSATPVGDWVQEAYVKAPNTDAGDNFGRMVAISSDTIVIGAYGEDSNQTTITNGTTASADNSTVNSGAAYVFKRSGTTWAQEAYLKAPNAEGGDWLGSVAISSDTIVVGAYEEDSNQTTITNGTTASADNSAVGSGAAYVFKRSGTTWAQEAYLKAPNAGGSDRFGYSVAIYSDTIVVGATQEASNQTTITNGTTASADNSAASAGAAYVFKRSGTTWAQEAYLKAPNAEGGDSFGTTVAVFSDTVVVGAPGEDSNQTTITNGTTASADNSAASAGAAYVFKRSGTTWAQEAYLKAPNAEGGDSFGVAVAVFSDTVVVGSYTEDSNQTTITNGATASANNGAADAGAVYVFKRSGTTWAQEAYLKAPNAEAGDRFGESVAIFSDTIVVGAYAEDSNQTTITNGATASANNGAADAGAVYVFKRSGTTWAQEAYLKAPNAEAGDWFGYNVAVSSDSIVVGAYLEDSNQTTITNGTTASADNSTNAAGAVYVFRH